MTNMKFVILIGLLREARAFTPTFSPLEPKVPTETKKTPEVVDEEAPTKPTDWFSFALDQQSSAEKKDIDWVAMEFNELGESETSSGEWFTFALDNKPRETEGFVSNNLPRVTSSDVVELFPASWQLEPVRGQRLVLDNNENSCDPKGADWFYFESNEHFHPKGKIVNRDNELYEWMAKRFSKNDKTSQVGETDPVDWFAVNSKMFLPIAQVNTKNNVPRGPVDWFAFAGFGMN